jgi:UPF0271 protein
MGNDALLLDYITSTNIACGWHAGDPTRMQKLVELAIQKRFILARTQVYQI